MKKGQTTKSIRNEDNTSVMVTVTKGFCGSFSLFIIQLQPNDWSLMTWPHESETVSRMTKEITID